MDPQPVIRHHGEFTVIGYSIVIKSGEGNTKCPEFWNEYSQRFARLFQTMKPETPEEQVAMVNYSGCYF